MTRVILPGPEEIAHEAADRIVKIAQEVLNEKPYFRFVLSGGSTPSASLRSLQVIHIKTSFPGTESNFFGGMSDVYLQTIPIAIIGWLERLF